MKKTKKQRRHIWNLKRRVLERRNEMWKIEVFFFRFSFAHSNTIHIWYDIMGANRWYQNIRSSSSHTHMYTVSKLLPNTPIVHTMVGRWKNNEIIWNAASIAVNIEQYHLHSVCTVYRERKSTRFRKIGTSRGRETHREREKFQVHRSIIIDTYKRQITA